MILDGLRLSTSAWGQIISWDFGAGIAADNTGTPVHINLATGTTIGAANSTSVSIIGSNGGGNLQVQVFGGADGGPIVTSGAPSYLAENFSLGEVTGPGIRYDNSAFPGHSTNVIG